MARKYIDCRESPETSRTCSVAISADSEEELLDAAAQHVVQVHGYEDTPELRDQLKDAIKEGLPGE
jgi:predicted small metal-binding protein